MLNPLIKPEYTIVCADESVKLPLYITFDDMLRTYYMIAGTYGAVLMYRVPGEQEWLVCEVVNAPNARTYDDLISVLKNPPPELREHYGPMADDLELVFHYYNAALYHLAQEENCQGAEK